MNALEISEKLYKSINQIVKEEDIIVIHSALSKLGFTRDKLFEIGLINVLEKLVDDGKTVLLPSFTFSFPKKCNFNINIDRSETGVFSDLACNKANFSRSHNPMFSFAVKGNKTKELMKCRSDSGYGEGTIVNRLVEDDVCIIMLGASWDSCTVIHTIEEKHCVPYREYVRWNYPIDFGEGPVVRPFELYVRKREPQTTLKFNRIREELIKSRVLREANLNNIIIEGSNGREVAQIAEIRIKEDPYFFVDLL